MIYLCVYAFISVDIPEYCKVHPEQVLEHKDNCAMYFNCSTKKNDFQFECKYPDLYSVGTMQCEEFTSVVCDQRPEPQAPCK